MLHKTQCQTTAIILSRMVSQNASMPPQGCAAATWAEEIPLGTLWPQCTAEGRHWPFPVWGRFWCSNWFAKLIYERRWNLSWDNFNFFYLWMLLLFLCPGTIRVVSFPVSSRLISSVPASSGSGVTAWFPLSTTFATALTPSPAGDPVTSLSRSSSERRSSLWAASRRAWLQTPHLTALAPWKRHFAWSVKN
jgi:hypothetical protein